LKKGIFRGESYRHCSETIWENLARRTIMLVLSRHENEAILIGGRIKVTVVEIRGHQIRLGIEAPGMSPFGGKNFVASAPKRDLAVA
jgi:hypothetical protein